jgi:hypothetical protein
MVCKTSRDEMYEQSNLGHAHFIAVFVEVFDFPSASLTRYVESKNNEEPEVSPLQDSNLFGNLDIEASMSDDEVGTIKSRRNAHWRLFAPANSKEDLQFDIFYFYSDSIKPEIF